ncbi:MAG TPA: hypothetical protein VNO52_13420 [Methylomirabilota bacterium]|nr:hypothetical protein [Methylomirabilota bacterium]
MNREIIQQWFEQHLAKPGVLAAGILWPDQTSLSRAFGASWGEKQLSDTWRGLAGVIDALGLQRIAARRLRWVYERGQVHFFIRPDGVALGILSGPGHAASNLINLLFSEFEQLGRPEATATALLR